MRTSTRQATRRTIGRRAVIATVAAAAAISVTAMPASAVRTNKEATTVVVSGVDVPAWKFASPKINNGDTYANRVTMVVDRDGGAQFSGRVHNGNIAWRHMDVTCTLHFGASHSEITYSTPRYRIGGKDSKTWDTGRRYHSEIQTFFSQIGRNGEVDCSLKVG